MKSSSRQNDYYLKQGNLKPLPLHHEQMHVFITIELQCMVKKFIINPLLSLHGKC